MTASEEAEKERLLNEALKKFPRDGRAVRSGQNPDVVAFLANLQEFERRSRERVIRVGGPHSVRPKTVTCAL